MTLRRLASTDDFVDHHRAGTAAAKGRDRREKRGAVRVRAVLDFEIGHLSLEDGRDRVGDRLRSRVGVVAIGLAEICAHWYCRAAGVGIGTFYQQFPDKADLMRLLMDDEHQYRVSAFDALAAKPPGDLASEVSRVLAGSDPALLRAMIEGCETDGRLRDFGRDLRKETHERLVAALARARESRKIRRPALDAKTASWAMLLMGDAAK